MEQQSKSKVDVLINRILQGKRINFARLTLCLALAIIIFSILFIFTTSRLIKEKSIRDLSKYEAQQISRLVYESLYAGMIKGWNKDDITVSINRLNTVRPDMKVHAYRGFPVISEFGDIPGEEEIRSADRDIMKAMSGQESLIRTDHYIRYLYPIIADRGCKACHKKLNAGDTAGVIDISYPIENLKVSLNFLVNVGLAFFIAFVIVVFIIFYMLINHFMINPIMDLVKTIREIISLQDMNKRVPTTSYITEVLSLTNHFNKLLHTVQEYYQQLEELSYKDPLTQIYNRRKFEEFLEYEVSRAKRYGHRFSVVMVDMDNFKYINDTFGHPVGDIVLKEVASILTGNIRSSDVAARMGGDEFAVMLPETEIKNGLIVAEKLRKALCETQIGIIAGNIRIQASFGMAEYPSNGDTMAELLTACDVALYRAKHLGRNKVIMLETEDKEVSMDVVSRGESLRRAIEEDRVEPFFQPIVDLTTGECMGVDVLATIKDGESRMFAKQFILSADELGYLESIDSIIFEKALARYPKVREALKAGDDLRLFFHSSPKRFLNCKFSSETIEAIDRHSIPHRNIVFQVSESAALPRLNDFIELLRKLREQEIVFSLKNFGTGFSSFMYLKYLDVSYVKIEGSYIRNIEVDERNRLLVSHIHQIVSKMGIKTIASFIEDRETGDILKGLGINYGVGIHFGTPRDI